MIDIQHYLSCLQKDKFTIFLFHGVIPEKDSAIRNYTNKHLLSKDFENLLVELKNIGKPISLDEAIDSFESKTSLSNFSYAITFDDGFENNYSIALPILEKHSTPATFYVSTNLIEKNLMSWIDQIEYCFEKSNNISLFLPWKDDSIQLSSIEEKINCLEDIRKQVKANQDLYEPSKIVSSIFKQCDKTLVSSSNHILDKKMNWSQVADIHQKDLFSIGGHSHNHLSLGLLNPIIMKNEIITSVEYLKHKANISSRHYSYPEGQSHDFNNSIITVLRDQQIKCCPTAIDGLNDLNIPSLFHLKRVMVY